ncbi:MAG TPA: hypothetical protein VKB78_02560, partial [Pirellulales bacterium]|nr:hypothetical protein [Pirellulales bacterium]
AGDSEQLARNLKKALAEHDGLLAAHDKLAREYAAVAADRDRLDEERFRLRGELLCLTTAAQTAEQKEEQSLREHQALASELSQIVRAHEELIGDRDRLVQNLEQTIAERDAVAAELLAAAADCEALSLRRENNYIRRLRQWISSRVLLRPHRRNLTPDSVSGPPR